MNEVQPSANPSKQGLRWYQFSLRSLLLAFVVCAPIFGWLSGRVKFQGNEQYCIAQFHKLTVYEWQSSRPLKSCFLYVDGKQRGGIDGGMSGPGASSVQLAVAQEEGKVVFYVRLGGASTQFDEPMEAVESTSTVSIQTRQLKVEGPTQVFAFEESNGTTKSTKKMEIIVE